MVAEILKVKGLGRRFGRNDVVRELDFSVAAGERVALRGPNGSGKTTVLRCIAGTLSPSVGHISVAGHRVGTLQAREMIGVSFSQERSFYLRLSALENLLFFARVRGHGASAAAALVKSLAEELELGSILATRADRCSTGMIQQLAFARALIGDPRLLLLDEPTRSLDADAVDRFWAALGRRLYTAVLIATHHEEDVDRCDRHIELPDPLP